MSDSVDPDLNPGAATTNDQSDQVVDGGGGQVLTPTPTPTSVGLGGKEQAPVPVNTEKIPLMETKVELEMDPEVQEYMERVQEDHAQLEKPIVFHGKTVLDNVGSSDVDNVVLPIDRSTLQVGMKAKVSTSLRWLATWCLRIMKKFTGNVVYSGQTESRDEV